MKKLIFGILFLVIGIFWTLISLSVLINDSDEVLDTVIILLFFLIPGIMLVFTGIKSIRKYKSGKIAETPVFDDKTILADWEINGREWERFKERKCSPDSINRTAFTYALFFGLGAGGFVALLFINQPTDIILFAGVISALMGTGISFYFFRKQEHEKYGFANSLNTCRVMLTHHYADFCGNVFPLNTNNRSVRNVRLLQRVGYSFLFFTLKKYTWYTVSYIYYEIPVPENKIDLAQKLIDDKRFDVYYVSDEEVMKTVKDLQRRFPRIFGTKTKD